MIQECDTTKHPGLIRPFLFAIAGVVAIVVISLWLGQALIAGGLPKENLNLIFLAILIPGLLIGMVGLTVISFTSFPNLNGKIEHYITGSLGKVILCFITGVINLILFLILCHIPIINCIVILLFIIFTSVGLSNISKIIGDKVYSLSNEETTPLKSVITGILVLEMMFILPAIGQLLFPIVLIIGLGGSIISLFIKRVGGEESIHQLDS